ncbi:MAG: ankyrin repeat domain-containing protein [Victivallaceae bacterium]
MKWKFKKTEKKSGKYFSRSFFCLISILAVMALVYFRSSNYRNQLDWLLADCDHQLLQASTAGNMALMNKLIKEGANVNICDGKGWTPLHYAAHEGYCSAIEILLKNGANIEARTDFLWTPLHLAAYQKQKDAVKCLLVAGAAVNARNCLGNTPLHNAVFQNAPEVCDVLLAAGADINRGNNSGSTPLDYAVHQGDYAIAEYLLINHAKPDSGKTGNIERLSCRDAITPLSRTAITGNVKIAALLLKYKAKINVTCRDGNTPLHFASKFKRKAMLCFLLNNHANPLLKNALGQLPCDMVDNPEIKELLYGSMFRNRLAFKGELVPLNQKVR